jgi:hypothetical protein
MTYREQSITPAAFPDPIHQSTNRRSVIRCRHGPGVGIPVVQALDPEGSLRQADPIDAAFQ